MWQIVGQTRVVDLLQRSLEKDSLAHAYLFAGSPNVGKMTLAINLAQALNCPETERPCGECASCQKIASANHADVQIVGLTRNENSSETRLRTEISIDQIRQLQHFASLPPFEGKYKVFIIEGAEFLSTEAANCLLKTLEEPADKVVFILLTTNEKLLPATVISRCQRLELTPLTAAEMENALTTRWSIEPQKASLLARLSRGCLGWALSAVSDESRLVQRKEKIEKLLEIISADYEGRFTCAAQLAAQFTQSREAVQEVLDLWINWWRDLLLVKIGCSDVITNIDYLATLTEVAECYRLNQIKAFIDSIRAAEEQLGQNANPRLALEVLMLDMPGKGKRGGGELAARVMVKND
ncbi:DNA polymerase III subunit delta' [Chloroflexota bacterium]